MKLPKTFKGIPLQVVSISMHKVNCAYMIFVPKCFLLSLNCVSVVYLLAICSQALLNIESNRRGPEFDSRRRQWSLARCEYRAELYAVNHRKQ